MYEGSLCVCCMSTEDLVLLFGCENKNSADENYANILSACLSVELSEDAGHDSICANCVSKLKACVEFKIQVLKSISILSSVEMNKLLDEENQKILGLYTPTEEELGQDMKNLKSSQLIDDVQKMVTQSDKILSDTDQDEIVKDTDIAQKPAPKVEPVKTGRRGRPRVHPPDTVPYKISNDELSCRECGQEFPNNVTLKVHYNTHFGKHKCPKCEKSFMTYGSLKKHETSHLEGPFHCQECDQVFRNKNSLLSHVRLKHKNPLPYRCKECGGGFRTVYRRLRHLADKHRIVEQKYHCHYCSKKFRFSGERAKHIANCHEIKYYTCPVCGARCRRAVLRLHLQRHLGLHKNKPTVNNERRFVCKLCSKTFTQKKTLQYHIGCHVRRGDYVGDPDLLILDNKGHKKNHGLLSEEDYLEEYLDENLLSDNQETEDDNIDKTLDITNFNIETIDNQIGYKNIDLQENDESVHEFCEMFNDFDK